MFQLYGKTLDWARTTVHYLMFFILGLMVSIAGPTIIDLSHSSNTDEKSVSYIYPARSIAYLVGSLIGGLILDCMKHDQIALIISSFVVALGAFIIPWCRSLPSLLVTFAIAGFAMGFSNTGSNACCLRIWGKKGAPYIQCLHFAFGFGGFLGPIIAAPYLSKEESLTEDLSLLGVAQNISTELLNGAYNITELELKITPSLTTHPQITMPYTIIGLIATVVCGCFILVYIFSSNEKNAARDSEQINIRDPGLAFTIVVVLLACLQTGLISGVEASFTQMLTSYVVKSAHKLSTSTGSYMTSVYWGAYTLTRLVSIILTWKVVSEKTLLIFDFILSVTSTVILLLLGTRFLPYLWAGTALLGIGVASIFPATLSWIEKYININNRVASVFTIVPCTLEMTAPFFINMYLETQPNVLFVFMTSATISCCVLFVILCFVLKRKGKKYIKVTQNNENEQPETAV